MRSCPKCGKEMRDLGSWPNIEAGTVEHLWHCTTCNEYGRAQIPGKRLVKQEDGSYTEEDMNV